ncbi:hypothetical protein RB595_007131 [Gaeumannomyces hyphopodioides]
MASSSNSHLPASASAGESSAQGAARSLPNHGPNTRQNANQQAQNNPTQYGHSDDYANTYLKTRLDERDAYKKRQDERGKRKIEEEMKRIEQARARFETYDDKKEMLDNFERARMAWRCEVAKTLKARRQEVQKYNEEERAKFTALFDRVERDLYNWQNKVSTVPRNADLSKSLGSDCGFEAGVMFFKRCHDEDGWEGCNSDHPWIQEGEFPNQKIRVHKLLEKNEANPLTRPPKSEDERLRWFHFPSNNMGWIEQAMARYYGEDDVVHDKHVKPHSQMQNAERLLCRELWHGQLHGSGDKAPIHARHMRSRFFSIPRESPTAGKKSAQDTNGLRARPSPPQQAASGTGQKAMNVALFIPYLHWETDSKLAMMVDAITYAAGKCKKERARGNKLANVVQVKTKAKKDKKWRWVHGRDGTLPDKSSKRPKLGEYLMQAAQMANAIDTERDERLLKENFHEKSPMHIRRTLDQFYFLTLEDTSERDRDQVVYRATKARYKLRKQIPRVVMVDQLWLWILDDHTIITSFPRRWGRNKPDSSGVHKCLRERLTNSPSVGSIYHLALMIINQCSAVFFDRTKPLDQRPEVIDMFSSAIGHVTEMTTIAYSSFWANTMVQNMLHSNPKPAYSFGQQSESKSQRHYLNINPEGTLLREGRDIAEELQIMHRVFGQQCQAVKEFHRHLDHMVTGNGRHHRKAGEQTVDLLVRDLSDMVRKEADRWHRDATPQPTGATNTPTSPGDSPTFLWLEDARQEADMLLESIGSRQAEIKELQDSACGTCEQLQALLSLKQQQASVVEAKAALDSAIETVNQGRSIVAFTIVTIFFMPLGFFTSFFGMNNQTNTGDELMTLDDQVKYMFGLSSVVIIIAISIAFSSRFHALYRRMKADARRKKDVGDSAKRAGPAGANAKSPAVDRRHKATANGELARNPNGTSRWPRFRRTNREREADGNEDGEV